MFLDVHRCSLILGGPGEAGRTRVGQMYMFLMCKTENEVAWGAGGLSVLGLMLQRATAQDDLFAKVEEPAPKVVQLALPHRCSSMFTDSHPCSWIYTDVRGCSWMFTDVH